MRNPLVIDTSIIFDVLRQREAVADHLVHVMATGGLVYLCPFVDFEVRRACYIAPVRKRSGHTTNSLRSGTGRR